MNEFSSLLQNILTGFQIGQPPHLLIILFGLAFARITAYLAAAPFFGKGLIPARFRVALAAALVILIFPGILTELPPPDILSRYGTIKFAALLIKEAMTGFTLGFVSSFAFEAIDVAGRVIDFQRGATISESFAPQFQEQVSLLSQFKLQFGLVIFLAMGAHRHFIATLLRSFEVIPLLGFPKLSGGWTPLLASLVALSGQILVAGLQLAAPAMVALLFTELLFGIMNRVAPQINVFFLSFPVKVLVGLMVTLLVLPMLANRFVYFFTVLLKYLNALVQTIGAASSGGVSP